MKREKRATNISQGCLRQPDIILRIDAMIMKTLDACTVMALEVQSESKRIRNEQWSKISIIKATVRRNYKCIVKEQK